MPKTLLRIVAVLLAVSLIADPHFAAAMTSASPARPLNATAFNQQALSPEASAEEVHPMTASQRVSFINRITRRAFFKSLVAGAASTPIHLAAQSNLSPADQQLYQDLRSYLESLAKAWSASGTAEEKRCLPYIRAMRDHFDFIDRASPMFMIGVGPTHPQGFTINSETGLVDFLLVVNPDLFTRLFSVLRTSSGQQRNQLEILIRGFLVKESETLLFIQEHPLLPATEQWLETWIQTHYGSRDKIRPNDVRKDAQLREIIKICTAIRLRFETAGYVKMVEYWQTNGLRHEDIASLAAGPLSGQTLLASLPYMLQLGETDPSDLYRLLAYQHLKNIVSEPNSSSQGAPDQLIYFRLALYTERVEGRANQNLPDHQFQPKKNPDGSVSKEVLAYLDDPDFYAPTVSDLERRFGTTNRWFAGRTGWLGGFSAAVGLLSGLAWWRWQRMRAIKRQPPKPAQPGRKSKKSRNSKLRSVLLPIALTLTMSSLAAARHGDPQGAERQTATSPAASTQDKDNGMIKFQIEGHGVTPAQQARFRRLIELLGLVMTSPADLATLQNAGTIYVRVVNVPDVPGASVSMLEELRPTGLVHVLDIARSRIDSDALLLSSLNLGLHFMGAPKGQPLVSERQRAVTTLGQILSDVENLKKLKNELRRLDEEPNPAGRDADTQVQIDILRRKVAVIEDIVRHSPEFEAAIAGMQQELIEGSRAPAPIIAKDAAPSFMQPSNSGASSQRTQNLPGPFSVGGLLSTRQLMATAILAMFVLVGGLCLRFLRSKYAVQVVRAPLPQHPPSKPRPEQSHVQTSQPPPKTVTVEPGHPAYKDLRFLALADPNGFALKLNELLAELPEHTSIKLILADDTQEGQAFLRHLGFERVNEESPEEAAALYRDHLRDVTLNLTPSEIAGVTIDRLNHSIAIRLADPDAFAFRGKPYSKIILAMDDQPYSAKITQMEYWSSLSGEQRQSSLQSLKGAIYPAQRLEVQIPDVVLPQLFQLRTEEDREKLLMYLGLAPANQRLWREKLQVEASSKASVAGILSNGVAARNFHDAKQRRAYFMDELAQAREFNDPALIALCTGTIEFFESEMLAAVREAGPEEQATFALVLRAMRKLTMRGMAPTSLAEIMATREVRTLEEHFLEQHRQTENGKTTGTVLVGMNWEEWDEERHAEPLREVFRAVLEAMRVNFITLLYALDVAPTDMFWTDLLNKVNAAGAKAHADINEHRFKANKVVGITQAKRLHSAA
jgi:hypothetical protein